MTFALALLGCEEGAEKRVRETFSVPSQTPMTEATIREAVIRTFPIGTREQDVYEIIKKLRIGIDGFSSFYPADKNGEIVCRFEYDPKEFGFVKKHYGIIIQLDDKHSIKDVKVHEWLTGL